MPIIGTLPNNIQNGQAVDASPVMADFNYIVNQVNANANPSGTLTAPSGTTALFYQAAAPSGWTISSGFTDHTVQVNAAAGGTTGGAANYSTMFQTQWTSDGHALTIAELAAHSHTDAGHTHSDAGHNHVQNGSTLFFSGPSTVNTGTPSFSANTAAIVTQTGFASIQTSAANIQNTGSGSAHTHTKTFNVNYVAMIMAVKS
jgi:hypothetical protein